MNYDTLLAVTSWEERFELGIKRFLSANSIQQLILFDFNDYLKATRNNINNLKIFLEDRNIKIEFVPLRHNKSINNWKAAADTINKISGRLVVDISTMPRDIIYFSLYHAWNSNKISNLYCLYSNPEGYSADNWLTSDPCKPQLIYNMSGIFEMGKDTILIILTGFDRKRVEQLLNYYEPKKVYMGVQTGKQYKNNILNAEQYIEFFKSFLKIERFDLNAYLENDYGFNKIEEIVQRNIDSNIIAASLGPKPSSIALFRLNKKYPNIGLIYVPVAKYNMGYSFGIDQNEPIFEQIK
jgi:hypothetical protein